LAKRNKGSSDLLYIKVKDNQIEQALKIFKQRVKENGLLLEIKEKSFYTKPSERRRTMKSIAKLRSKKDLDNIYKKFH
jgi:small subunit ribosomal protein S21|tara:strand:+ start:1176 stop:1409 length:234 start_codon:yes stop_codon:yes gene_type:complete